MIPRPWSEQRSPDRKKRDWKRDGDRSETQRHLIAVHWLETDYVRWVDWCLLNKLQFLLPLVAEDAINQSSTLTLEPGEKQHQITPRSCNSIIGRSFPLGPLRISCMPLMPMFAVRFPQCSSGDWRSEEAAFGLWGRYSGSSDSQNQPVWGQVSGFRLVVAHPQASAPAPPPTIPAWARGIALGTAWGDPEPPQKTDVMVSLQNSQSSYFFPTPAY